jgi:Tol biopolymer transport system component
MLQPLHDVAPVVRRAPATRPRPAFRLGVAVIAVLGIAGAVATVLVRRPDATRTPTVASPALRADELVLTPSGIERVDPATHLRTPVVTSMLVGAAVSPDRSRVAYLSVNGSHDRCDLVVLDLGTGERRNAGSCANEGGWRWHRGVRAAPGGLLMNHDSFVPEPYTYRSASVQLATGYGPAWSPDGNLIAFSCRGLAICLARTDGGSTRRVAGSSYGAAFSPDGTRLSYIHPRTDRTGLLAQELWVADGSGQRPHRAWRPPTGWPDAPTTGPRAGWLADSSGLVVVSRVNARVAATVVRLRG